MTGHDEVTQEDFGGTTEDLRIYLSDLLGNVLASVERGYSVGGVYTASGFGAAARRAVSLLSATVDDEVPQEDSQ